MKVNDALAVPPENSRGPSAIAPLPAARTAEAADIAFWRAQLEGSEPALDLPFDHPRPPEKQRSAPTLRRTIKLSDAVARALRETAEREKTTLFVTLLAAFEVLLHRWTGQADLVVGAVLRRGSSATGADAATALPVPHRFATTGNPSFRAAMQSVGDMTRTALAHQHVALDRLAQELRPDRATERQPFFQAVFEFIENGDASAEAAGESHYDLTLGFVDHERECVMHVDGNRELFSADTLDRLLRSLATLLAGIAADPETTVLNLPVVPADELKKLIVQWNDTALPYEKQLCIHEAFERQVRRNPDAIAVVGEGERISYAQLNAEADRLADALRRQGVGPETLVGIFLRRTPRLVSGMLGVLKAGGAYVPLDPNYPAERLRFIMEDTRMPVLVTEQALDASDVPAGTKVLRIDALPEADATKAPEPARKPNSENLAYVIYTSGSTGKPKGVCLAHRVVIALAAWAEGLYSMEELAGVLFATSACFDVSIFECLVPLCLGGKIIVAPNILEVGALSARNEITLISGVPSAMAEVVRSGAMPPSVRTVNVAGEPCPQSLIDQLHALGHVKNVYDVYGPTETTVYSIGGPRHAGGRPTIGRPLPNERAYILDAQLNPVPQGVRGELFIGGEKLARGYCNRPDLTAEKFITIDWLQGERVYRTGDVARWLPDGTLEFLGRIDRQVKIRGFRVEPGEVESVLRKQEGVAECAVVPRDDGAGAKILVAYVVGAQPAPDFDAMRAFLAERLPEYLVPTSFVALPALPRSPNGKLDVRALPAPGAQPERKLNYAPPRDGVEQQLVRVWEEILGVKGIGIHDRFMDLGGHSLQAVRMAALVEKKFGRKLPVSILFRAPTIERLARAIRDEGLITMRSSLVEIQPEGTRQPIFWLHTLGGGGGAGLFRYGKLARHLGSDQPSYGLVAPNGDQPETFEEMAAFYIREIRAVQPEGPYCVGGYCFGGVLAYEVGRQLEASGAGSGTVIILDGLPPNPPGIPGFKSWTFASHFLRTLPGWLAARLKHPEDITRRARGFMRRFFQRSTNANAGAASAPRSIVPAEQIEDFIDMEQYPAEFRALAAAHWRAMTTYRPKPFGGHVILLKTHRPSLLKYAPEFQWRILAPDLKVETVPGNHSNMLDEPQVSLVAAAIGRLLEGGDSPASVGRRF